MAQPTLVLIHGAWHVPEHYARFADMLREDGSEVYVPQLPSCGPLAAQSNLASDVQVVRALLLDLSSKGKKIIVIAHSYGGAVAGDALRDMSLEERKSQNLPGGVLHIIYMCAFMLQPGDSVASASQPPPDPHPVEPADDGTCFLCQLPKELFYADVDDEVAKEAEDALVRWSIAALTDPVSHPAWLHIPTTFLACTEDKVHLPLWQQALIKAAQEKTTIEVHTFKSSHSPFLSLPNEMVDVVRRVAAKYH